MKRRPVQFNLRGLLLALGMGDFNATIVIQVMQLTPSQTDPDMPPVILLTRQIQLALNKMGAGIVVSGALDQPTADAIKLLAGPGYLSRPWYVIVETVLSAQRAEFRYEQIDDGSIDEPVPMAGALDFLPAVPGGALTYAAGAAALLYYFTKKKR